jgi:hypothetical protein
LPEDVLTASGKVSGGQHDQVVESPPESSRRAPSFTRGGRARELAYATELQFGKLPCDRANYEVARRFASRHPLTASSSVRASHQAALVKRAMEIYFVLTEEDLADTFVVFNKINAKRTKQRAVARC